MLSFLRISKRIIVITIAVDIVRVELVDILPEIDEKETATC
jgi:hypothetical protein